MTPAFEPGDHAVTRSIAFLVTTDLRAFEHHQAVHAAAWSFCIPRDLV